MDAVGVMNSIMWKMQLAIQEATYTSVPLFDGPRENYTVPSCLNLRDDHVFNMLGRYFAFAKMNTDVAFYGLNSLFGATKI